MSNPRELKDQEKQDITIKIGIPQRLPEKFNRENLEYIKKLNDPEKNFTIKPIEIDWHYALDESEVKKHITEYEKELNATKFSDRKEEGYTQEEKEKFLVEAKQSYEITIAEKDKSLDQLIDSYLVTINALYIPGIAYNPDKKNCVDDLSQRVAAIGDRIEPDKRREIFEQKLVKKALEKGIPVLGVCAGSWLVATCFEGSKTSAITTMKGPEAYRLHDQAGWRPPIMAGGTEINRSRVDVHSVQIAPGTMLHSIAKNASSWTPKKDKENKLLKQLQYQKISSSPEISLSIRDKKEINQSAGYHLTFDSINKEWQLSYFKRDTANLIENAKEIKLSETPVDIDMIKGLRDFLANKTLAEAQKQHDEITDIISNNQLMFVNSTHWRVVVQDEKLGKIDRHDQLIVSAIEPTYKTIEAFETRFGVPVMGIQWHPELAIPQWITQLGCTPNPEFPANRKIVDAFVESAHTHANKTNCMKQIKHMATAIIERKFSEINRKEKGIKKKIESSSPDTSVASEENKDVSQSSTPSSRSSRSVLIVSPPRPGYYPRAHQKNMSITSRMDSDPSKKEDDAQSKSHLPNPSAPPKLKPPG